MITLAFYKGRSEDWWHRIEDAGIRLVTGGRYSLVEFIEGAAEFGSAQC